MEKYCSIWKQKWSTNNTKRNFNKKLDNSIKSILKTNEIVIPIFRAFSLSSELFNERAKEANATALSAESNNSKLIKIGNTVMISYQLSIWSKVGINELTEAVSIKYIYALLESNIM